MPSQITDRPSSADYATYYANYIKQVPPGDLVTIAEQQIASLRNLLSPLSPDQSRFRYAEGKWSIREVIGHLTDTERVFAYRATSFSRADRASLPGYDQAEWNPLGEYDSRDLPDLLDEWEAARRASVALMRGMPAVALGRRGVASNNEFSTLALLAMLPGHVSYHMKLLERDYLSQKA